MPTNRELTTVAEALSEELGVSVETRGLNNAKLVELVERLQAIKAERQAAPAVLNDSSFETSADVAEEPDTIPPEAEVDLEDLPDELTETVIRNERPPAVQVVDGAAETPTGGVRRNRSLYRFPYTVAEGVQIVSRRGRLPAFAQIRDSDLSGGLDELEKLVRSGHVVKRK